ncbi:MAG: spore coat protein CotH, partial [Clostridia bacterium]|nr:spore coat protein CotH [Clostridia bacterium]
ARDINFNTIVLSMEDVILPATEIDMLPKGQYFIKVTATNKSGYTQTAFDYYFTDGSKNYGVKCFYIDAKGNVVEDVYEG